MNGEVVDTAKTASSLTCSACGGTHPKFRCTKDGRIGKQARPA